MVCVQSAVSLLLSALVAVSAAGSPAMRGVAQLRDAFLWAHFSSDPIPADGAASSTLQVGLLRISGPVASDGVVVTVVRDEASAAVCTVDGGSFAQRPLSGGGVAFAIGSTTVPGICHVTASADGTVPAEAQLVTRPGGTPTRLTVSGNNSPKTVGLDPITIGVDIDDVFVNLVGDDASLVSVSFDAPTCSGSPAGDVYAESAAVAASGGRAWFSIHSMGSYVACALTFAAFGVRSATTTVSFVHGGPDHLACRLDPTVLGSAGAIAHLSAELRDTFGNPVDNGSSSYVVSAGRVRGTSTELVGGSQQPMTHGAAFFAVRSADSPGTDEYAVWVAADSPTALPAPLARCSIELR